MFGKNPVMGPRYDKPLLVKEIFPTIQGEGPNTGWPAVFVRLGGCNLRCYFCDTEFSNDLVELDADVVAKQIERHRFLTGCQLVVVTGGEPLLQNVSALVDAIATHAPEIKVVQFETAGTVWPKGFEAMFGRKPSIEIVVSPKTTEVHPMVRRLATAWKYIVKVGNPGHDGLPWRSTQDPDKATTLARPSGNAPVYVQPMDEQDPVKNQQNISTAINTALRFGYRVSLQTHKIMGMP